MSIQLDTAVQCTFVKNQNAASSRGFIPDPSGLRHCASNPRTALALLCCACKACGLDCGAAATRRRNRECSIVDRTPTLLSRLIWFVLRRLYDWKGWQLEERAPPPMRKYILLGAPHTSNWDFVFFAGAARKIGIRPRFVGKHSLFAWPMTRFMYDMGGMPVDRSQPGGYVQAVVEAFAKADDMALVIAPEGTRSSNGEWRTGFYRIAVGAGVPIVPAWVDHVTKQGGLGEPIMPSGDYLTDLAKIADFYRSKMPHCKRFEILQASARQ